MSKVVVNLNSNYVFDKLDQKVTVANRLILDAIQKESRKRTPLAETGQLRGQVSKKVITNHAIITWQVPYASYQERGMRYDGSHVIKHWTTPGTGPDFAKEAVAKVLDRAEDYYRLVNNI